VAEYACGYVVDPRNFWLAVAALAARLQQRGPIDYGHRRQVLSTLTSIDAAVWGPVFARHGVRLMPATCRAAAVLLWTALTCGELTDGPRWPTPTGRRCRQGAACAHAGACRIGYRQH
jgi:hypothetical protein